MGREGRGRQGGRKRGRARRKVKRDTMNEEKYEDVDCEWVRKKDGSEKMKREEKKAIRGGGGGKSFRGERER